MPGPGSLPIHIHSFRTEKQVLRFAVRSYEQIVWIYKCTRKIMKLVDFLKPAIVHHLTIVYRIHAYIEALFCFVQIRRHYGSHYPMWTTTQVFFTFFNRKRIISRLAKIQFSITYNTITVRQYRQSRLQDYGARSRGSDNRRIKLNWNFCNAHVTFL